MEKVRRKNSRHYIDNMSIKNSFVFYALISLVIGIVIGVISITLADDYRINLNYKYEDMTTRYDIPENGSFTAKYNKDQTEYTIYNASEKEVCNFVVDYQKERPVQEYIYPNHVSYIEVSPKFTKHDRIVDSALGVVNIVTIPIVLSISMILCVTIFVNRKLVRPIKLLTNAYRKVENNELDFTLPYPYKDEMGRLCLAFEKMKNCLYQNNQKMIRQFNEQRRLNAAFSHDLRTPLTILKGHTTMLLSFIPKGLVSQLTQLYDPSKDNEDDAVINPTERLSLPFDISSVYGELPSGHYRIIVSISYFESPKDWDYDTYYLACEFTLK